MCQLFKNHRYNMKNGNIEDILAKKTTGEASQAELSYLEDWRSESVDNQTVYDEYSLLWDNAVHYSNVAFNPNFEAAFDKHLAILTDSKEVTNIINLTPNRVEDKKIITSTQARIFSFKNIQRVAAVLVLGVASYFLFNTDNTSITSSDQIQFASLEDGSSIWLDKGATISYDEGFGSEHRNLKLTGKAFFDVERNESIPFNITTSDFEVSVLGTSFTVDEGNFVDVTSGSVKVTNSNSNVILTENKKAILANGKLTESVSLENGAMWRNPSLTFDNAPLSQVIADINLYHNNKLELNSSASIECSFTSKNLVNESIENIVAILKLSYGLEVNQSEDGKSILTISECI